MPLMTCPKCERFHYVPGECLAPKSTAARKDVHGGWRTEAAVEIAPNAPPAGTQAPPVDTTYKDTRKADRHPPGYQAAKQKLYRERKKAKT